MTKAQIKRNRDRVEKLYGQACNGVQVPIMSLGKIMAAGLAAVEAGLDDAGITAKIVEVVATVRTN